MSPASNPIVRRFTALPKAGTAVLVGDFATAAPFPHFAAALRAEGWNAAEIDIRHFLSSPGSKWLNRIADRLLPNAKPNALAGAVEGEVANTAADIVIFGKGMGATPESLVRLAERGCRTVCWYPDFHFDHPYVQEEALAAFDLFVTTKEFQLPYLRQLRGEKPTVLIEHGWCLGLHVRLSPPVEPAARPFDVMFVGNHSPYKQKWLEDLVQSLPGISLAVAGHRWSGCGAKFSDLSLIHI